jgi:hypothetical protein
MQMASVRAALVKALGWEKKKPGKEFPAQTYTFAPSFLFASLSGRLVLAAAFLGPPAWFAPEVYDLRRLSVQPGLPLDYILASPNGRRAPAQSPNS